NATPDDLMLCLALLIRCAIVASGTRNALAISAVVSPPTARSVSAIAEEGESAEWQHMKRSTSVSSVITPSSASGGETKGCSCACSLAASFSRRRLALSLRTRSLRRLIATLYSQPRGFVGTPAARHCVA